MTAICKTILIHGSSLQNILDYGSDQEKTSINQNGLSNALEYGANPLKTLANPELSGRGNLRSPVSSRSDSRCVNADTI